MSVFIISIDVRFRIMLKSIHCFKPLFNVNFETKNIIIYSGIDN